MSRYDEDKKEQIAEDIKQWLLKNTRLRQNDIEVYQHHNHEAYVTIEIDHNASDHFPGWNTEQVRNMTDIHLDLVDVQGHSLSVSPA